jgi:hypothetical protein
LQPSKPASAAPGKATCGASRKTPPSPSSATTAPTAGALPAAGGSRLASPVSACLGAGSVGRSVANVERLMRTFRPQLPQDLGDLDTLARSMDERKEMVPWYVRPSRRTGAPATATAGSSARPFARRACSTSPAARSCPRPRRRRFRLAAVAGVPPAPGGRLSNETEGRCRVRRGQEGVLEKAEHAGQQASCCGAHEVLGLGP